MPVSSITLRISLLFTGLAALVFMVMGIVIVIAVSHHFDRQDRDLLRGKLELIQNILNEHSRGNTDNLTRKLGDAMVGHHDLAVLVLAPDGSTVFLTGHKAFLQHLSQSATAYDRDAPLHMRKHLQDGKKQYQAVSVKFSTIIPGQTYIAVVAFDMAIHTVFLHMFESVLLLIGVSGLMMMAILGLLAARRGLQPLRELTHIAGNISARQLDERLQPARYPLEIEPLASAFNAMLDRLGESFNRLSDYASDIAHELRTPINNLMMQTQVSLGKSRSADEYREILYSNLEEYERLANMISDMLFLAKADNGLMVPNRERMSLREEVNALCEFYEALAADRNVELRVKGDARISGDRLMIRRAISNLLSNAIRHSYSDNPVQIRIDAQVDQVSLTVCNQGAPIPPEQQERIFDRFHRVDASRMHTDEGAGLGLAITRSIVEAHQGQIGVRSAANETCFEVKLPATVASETGV